MEILRRGSEGEGVRRWQNFLIGQKLLDDSADGVFGPLTEAATKAFQRRRKLRLDGVVGPLTYAAALQSGFDPGFADPHGGTSGGGWPPPPVFAPLVSNIERAKVFGEFRYERIAGSDQIRILGDWESRHLVRVTIAQLRSVKGGPKTGVIRVHRLVQEQFKALFERWEAEGLLPLIRSWDGGFNPRFVRGSTRTLSNHAWGTGFDINAAHNPLGAVPPLRGEPGSVRELVPTAHRFGFYWGGHFSRSDGMHFEVARVLA